MKSFVQFGCTGTGIFRQTGTNVLPVEPQTKLPDHTIFSTCISPSVTPVRTLYLFFYSGLGTFTAATANN